MKEHKADINRAGATKAAVEALTATIVAPLRERLERAVGDAAGDNEELANMVRGLYREWKTQRIDEHLDDVARAASAGRACRSRARHQGLLDGRSPRSGLSRCRRQCPRRRSRGWSAVPYGSHVRAGSRGLPLHACVSSPLVSPGCGTRPTYRLVGPHRCALADFPTRAESH